MVDDSTKVARQAVPVNLVVIASAVGLLLSGTGALAVVALVCALVSLGMAVIKLARHPDPPNRDRRAGR